MKFNVKQLTKATALVMLLCAFALSGCKKTSSTTSTSSSTASSNVTIAGTMNIATANIAGPVANLAGPGALKAAVASDYKLYCVTFSNPPIGGNGTFDGTGKYSVTLAGAAGKPVGCFINDATTGAIISTVTFSTGQKTATNKGGTSSNAALKGGAQTMNISFNPTKKSASADVTTAIDTTAVASSTFNTADISGIWNLSCDSANNTKDEQTACTTMLGTSALPIYTDILKGTDASGNAVAALSVWQSQTAFANCGSTEALTNLAADGITNVTTSLSMTDHTAIFNSPIFKLAAYNKTTNSIPVTDLVTHLKTLTGTFSYYNTASCSGNPGNLPLTTVQGRICLVEYLDKQAWGSGNTASCFPVPKSSTWDGYGYKGTATSISFNTNLEGITPTVSSRYDVMELKIIGDAAVASSHYEGTYNKYTATSATPTSCSYSDELSVSFTKVGTGAAGRFTQITQDTCESTRNRSASFSTIWAR